MNKTTRKACILLCLVSMIAVLFAGGTAAGAEGLRFSKSDYNNVSEEAADAVSRYALRSGKGTFREPRGD